MELVGQHIWLDRGPQTPGSGSRYAVLDTLGRMLGLEVVLPPKTRLVGVSRSGDVFLARRDDDEFEFVGRYRVR